MILVTQLVVGIGIRPAKTLLVHEISPNHAGTFWVVNNDQTEFLIKVRVEGELAEYVTLHTQEILFGEDDNALPVSFELSLPENVPPGVSTANIIVEQEIEGTEGIGSRIVLKHKIIVQGEYPDKYIIAKLNFHEGDDSIELVSEVENLGKRNISELQTKFYLNNKKQEAVVLDTEEISLARKENKLLSARIEKDLVKELGEFEVRAVTTYDGQKVEVIKNMIRGKPDVEISYFDEYMVAHKINEYSMDLLNKWNKKIENVFVDVEIRQNEKKVDSFRTRSVDIDGEITKRINDFYDAREKSVGEYTFVMIVHFWNMIKMESKSQEFTVELLSEDDYESKEISLPSLITGGAVVDIGKGVTWTVKILAFILAISITSALIYRWSTEDEDKEF